MHNSITSGHRDVNITISLYSYITLFVLSAFLGSITALLIVPVLGTAMIVLAYNHGNTVTMPTNGSYVMPGIDLSTSTT